MIARVTFDDLYPRARAHDEPIPGVFKARGQVPQVGGPCWVCRRLTTWISLAFEAPVCSAVCDGIGWHRYLQAWAPLPDTTAARFIPVVLAEGVLEGGVPVGRQPKRRR